MTRYEHTMIMIRVTFSIHIKKTGFTLDGESGFLRVHQTELLLLTSGNLTSTLTSFFKLIGKQEPSPGSSACPTPCIKDITNKDLGAGGKIYGPATLKGLLSGSRFSFS
ncbi:hypothetical protein CEXT_345811 [Caerostris extrusa]|uniref:Uncharacterized protein n=1 Tax=Caerostris extrusa TaxID=172846 RepID=A0AAV4VTP5_CAEEX|nr:hypothetical protein CEXT_345811 [Caerostris extrusa]